MPRKPVPTDYRELPSPAPDDPTVVSAVPPAYARILQDSGLTEEQKIELITNGRSLARAIIRIYLEENGAPVSEE